MRKINALPIVDDSDHYNNCVFHILEELPLQLIPSAVVICLTKNVETH